MNKDADAPVGGARVAATPTPVMVVKGPAALRQPGERKDHHMKFFKTPKETITAIGVAGFNKGQLTIAKTFLQAILAGILLSFGGLVALVLSGGLSGIGATNPGVQHFATGAVFPVGLVLIVMTGAELFTGNTMFLAAALFTRQTHWSKVLSNWLLVFFGNLAGSLLFAYFLAFLTEILAADPLLTFTKTGAEKKVQLGWGVSLLRGIGGNWMVTLALWCATVAEDSIGKWIGVWFPIMTFAAVGFEHCVANMFYIPIGMMLGANVTVGEFVWFNLVPVALGNIITGVIFVAGAYVFVFLTPTAPDDDISQRQQVYRTFKWIW